MATGYSFADEDTFNDVARRLTVHRPDLAGAGVRVGVLMAWNPDGPAVKHGGYPAAATIKVIAHRDRVSKQYDAELVIDQTIWDGLRPRQREALIAHELQHLELVIRVDDEGGQSVQLDDGGRPKLKTRPGDWNAGDGFAEVVAEFGDDAVEYANLRQCWRLADQAKECGHERGADGGNDAAGKVAGEVPQHADGI